MKAINKYLAIAIGCTLALTACGGDSDSSGIDANLKKGQYGKKTDPVDNTNKANQWLKAHNAVRKKHRVKDLVWSEKLAKSAEKFAKTCPTGHSKLPYGENMAMATYVQQPQNVVQRWYSEESKYNYKVPKYSRETGHFTQLVWKDTTEVGCAQVSNCGGKWSDIVVCEYDPAGNSGNYVRNVLPPK